MTKTNLFFFGVYFIRVFVPSNINIEEFTGAGFFKLGGICRVFFLSVPKIVIEYSESIVSKISTDENQLSQVILRPLPCNGSDNIRM